MKSREMTSKIADMGIVKISDALNRYLLPDAYVDNACRVNFSRCHQSLKFLDTCYQEIATNFLIDELPTDAFEKLEFSTCAVGNGWR